MRRLTPLRSWALPRSRAGRALLAFWAVLLTAACLLVGTLQWLGPPPPPKPAIVAGGGHPPSANTTKIPAPAAVAALPAPVAIPDRPDIAPPDAALLEPDAQDPHAMLPRIAADGRPPRLVYATHRPPAPPGVPPGSKRVAIVLSGIGFSIANSLDAVDELPAAVGLAVSPYAEGDDTVLDAARKTGHELLLTLPMEPAGAPLDEEGGKALTEMVGSDENMRRLDWSLSRIEGYAGVTNAAGALGGESFAGSLQFPTVVRAIAARGLFWLDATPDSAMPAGIYGAKADLRLDGPESAEDINQQLAALEQIAHDKGSAIGVVGPVYPVTVQRLAEWIQVLPTRGLVLVPVSSLIHPPEPVLSPAAPDVLPGAQQ